MNITERPQWQQRVFKERDDLKERITKLEAVVHASNPLKLADKEMDKLRSQLTFMIGYLECLEDRITSF